ncbi:hypothetical protein RHMOL_Rhmol11G0129800 [Rhododendron molle]|uniref:Uncharacterized protein n=1 Tax=Rhododendron molle TaxID=49168 RepID=A0ACC0LRY5_RHOML|nr:hypothetical protein RHMOL_Rhmol11G0129800 [Rhododendron molle]
MTQARKRLIRRIEMSDRHQCRGIITRQERIVACIIVFQESIKADTRKKEGRKERPTMVSFSALLCVVFNQTYSGESQRRSGEFPANIGESNNIEKFQRHWKFPATFRQVSTASSPLISREDCKSI